MGRGIGINDMAPDEGKIKGKQEPVACGTWCTSKGKILVKLMKYKNKNGEIMTISPIHVLSYSKKNYCGIPTQEFECEAVIDGYLKRFRLNYDPERDQPWNVIW